MLAVPDPTFDRHLPPRYERARTVLLPVFAALEERGKSVIVASLGFTRDSGVLVGWSDDGAQIRSVLEHDLVPGLFTRAGTSLEAAVDELVDVFDTLPNSLREESRRVAILVSDGEDTTDRSWLPYALDRLSSSPLQVIALQTGSLQYDEGVPRYGELGEFLGFERMGGALYTVPNAKAMGAIASAPRRGGLYVRAEDPAATERILQFLDSSRSGGTDRNMLAFVLLLFAVTTLLCARILR
ncbi:MAG TPA: vWA domain-containing protein [Woeseiaceae bacterium]|nr:vWA domain-containing protein [Woeseiaceae bacterium]